MASPVINYIDDVYYQVGDLDRFVLSATDADSDPITWSVDSLPTGVNLTGDAVQGVYLYEETVKSTFTATDGTNPVIQEVLFNITRNNYYASVSSVSIDTLPSNSPFKSVLGSGKLSVGDVFDYPKTVSNRFVTIFNDGSISVTGSGDLTITGVYIRRASNSYLREGPYTIIYDESALTSPFIAEKIIDPLATLTRFYGNEFKARINKCSSDAIQIQLRENGTLFNTVNATKIKIEIKNNTFEYCANSVSNPSKFDLSAGTGLIDFVIGDIIFDAGFYDLTVQYFDSANPKGVYFTQKKNICIEAI